MEKSSHYILDENGEVKGVNDVLEWARWFEANPDRHIGYTKIFGKVVSTVFLGLDYSFSIGMSDVPIVWETMIFGGVHDQYQERYATKEEALKGHREAVWLVIKSLPLELWLKVRYLFSNKEK